MKVWKLLPIVSAPMSFQLALDEVLFRHLEIQNKTLSENQDKTWESLKPILRVYFSSEPWITLGYFSEISADSTGIPVCRRLTGGGKVLHGKDLIFSLIAHKSASPSFRSVEESYLKIHDAVRGAFESLGQKADFFDANQDLPKGGDCFTHPISSDLKLGGKKVAGGAQKRSAGILLHQESIQIPDGLNPNVLDAALRKSFERHFGAFCEDTPWNPEVLRQAKILSADGYIPGRWSEKDMNQEIKI